MNPGSYGIEGGLGQSRIRRRALAHTGWLARAYRIRCACRAPWTYAQALDCRHHAAAGRRHPRSASHREPGAKHCPFHSIALVARTAPRQHRLQAIRTIFIGTRQSMPACSSPVLSLSLGLNERSMEGPRRARTNLAGQGRQATTAAAITGLASRCSPATAGATSAKPRLVLRLGRFPCAC